MSPESWQRSVRTPPRISLSEPSGAHGGYRQDVVLPARSVTRVPSGSGDVAGSTLPTNSLTARQALDVLALQPGQVLAVTGAAGAFGLWQQRQPRQG